MILGYPGTPSTFPGSTLLFHVSTDAPEFRVEIYRMGLTLERAGRSGWLPGRQFPLIAPYLDWSEVWQGRPLRLPPSLRPGVYIAMFVEGDGHGKERTTPEGRPLLDRTSPDARYGKALFVVRNPRPAEGAAILYKIPLFSYAAYNGTGDPRGSLYIGPGREVTLHRPGNGTGGTPWDIDIPDAYDPTTPRQTFAHWDAKLVRWLEANGIAVDFATDLDVHRNDGDFLDAYRLLLSVGHDEYWSEPMRTHVEAFIARGGNVAFFSGNVCYWRVTVTAGETAIAVDKRMREGDRVHTGRWSFSRPEDSLTGVSYHNAGGHWEGPRPSNGGYTVRHAGHWVFAGTGLTDGAVFGEAEGVVGYECDGAAFTLGPSGIPFPTGTDGTPLDFVILATASVAGWEGAQAGARSTATMGLYTRGGIVFTAATTDWARALGAGDACVDRITRNVIERLRARAVPIAGPCPARCGRRVAVRGETATFHVTLPHGEGLSSRWSASAGTPERSDALSFSLAMPDGPGLVTISVSIGAPGRPPAAFGTLTIRPFSEAEALWFEALCALGEIALAGGLPRAAEESLGAAESFFVDAILGPLDPEPPFFYRPEALPSVEQVSTIERAAERLLGLVRRLGSGLRS